MERKYILNDDYDQKEKIKKEEIFCYSKKQLKKLYPNEDYKIVGEIKGKFAEEDDKEFLTYRNRKYVIDPYGTANKLIYGRKRFILVDNDEYVVLLNNRIIFILLFGIISLFIGLSLYFILNFGNELLNPIPTIDPNIHKNDNDLSEKVESEDGGGSVSLAYKLTAQLSLATNNIEMYIENPNSSNQEVQIELYLENGDKDICIAKSGLISPGYSLSLMEFNERANLSQGVYSGYYHVKFYSQKTGELSLIESNIEQLEVTVIL